MHANKEKMHKSIKGDSGSMEIFHTKNIVSIKSPKKAYNLYPLGQTTLLSELLFVDSSIIFALPHFGQVKALSEIS